MEPLKSAIKKGVRCSEWCTLNLLEILGVVSLLLPVIPGSHYLNIHLY